MFFNFKGLFLNVKYYGCIIKVFYVFFFIVYDIVEYFYEMMIKCILLKVKYVR